MNARKFYILMTLALMAIAFGSAACLETALELDKSDETFGATG